MKSIYLFTTFLFLSLSSTAQIVDESFLFDGVQRSHKVFLPANFSENMPLVLNLHGYTSNSFQQLFYSSMVAVADDNHFVVVFPDGTTDQYGITFWNSEILGEDVNDLGYLEALIDTMIENYNINPDRVYMCGMSNGGFMSYYSACEMTDKIAAIASVTGTMNNEILDNCNPTRSIPVLEIHGTADATVPYNGANSGGSFQSMIATEEVLDFWVNHNNCTLEFEEEMEDISLTDLSTVTHFKYSGAENDATVEHYRINDGGHTWPGAALPLPGVVTNYDIVASEVIWDFFKQYDISGYLELDELIEESTFSINPNPMRNSSIIESDNLIQSLIVYDLQGKVVLYRTVNNFSCILEKESLKSGMYFIELIGDNSLQKQKLLVE